MIAEPSGVKMGQLSLQLKLNFFVAALARILFAPPLLN